MTATTLSRRALLLAALASGAARADEATLPMPASLAQALGAAQGRQRALVVMFSLPGCPWCKLVRQSYLRPLHTEGQPVIEVDMTGTGALTGFDGAPTTGAQMAQTLGVHVSPTLLFIGRGGREVAGRLRGVPNEDFYGAYLQQHVEEANRAAV
jgi:thioredoxin-related protein